MEVMVMAGLVVLSIIGLLALDRDGLRQLDTDAKFEDDEYFTEHR